MYANGRVPERFTPNNVMGRRTRGYVDIIAKIAAVIKDTRVGLSDADLQAHKALFNTADQCLHKAIGFRRKEMHFHMDRDRRFPGSGIEDIIVR